MNRVGIGISLATSLITLIGIGISIQAIAAVRCTPRRQIPAAHGKENFLLPKRQFFLRQHKDVPTRKDVLLAIVESCTEKNADSLIVQ